MTAAGWTESLCCASCGAPVEAAVEREDAIGIVAGELRCQRCGRAYPIRDGVYYLTDRVEERKGQAGVWKPEDFANLLPESGLYRTHAEWLEHKLGYPERIARQVSAYESRFTKERLLDLMCEGAKRTVLDLGCGVGYLTFDLLSRKRGTGMRAVCLDVLPQHVRFVRERQVEESVPEILPVVGDAERLPLTDGSVDGVMCSEVMEHVPDPKVCAKEIFRVLSPDGTVVVSTPNREPYERYNRIRLALWRILGKGAGTGEDFYENPLHHKDLIRTFEAAGFRVEAVEFGIKVPMAKRLLTHMNEKWAMKAIGLLEAILPGKHFGVSTLVLCRKPALAVQNLGGD